MYAHIHSTSEATCTICKDVMVIFSDNCYNNIADGVLTTNCVIYTALLYPNKNV